mgnify:CR=1 FL=1
MPTAEAPTRTKRSVEDQILDLQLKLDAKKSRQAVRTMAATKPGKKLLGAMRALKWVLEHPEDSAESVVAASSEALETLVAKLSKAYGIRRTELEPKTGTAEAKESGSFDG